MGLPSLDAAARPVGEMPAPLEPPRALPGSQASPDPDPAGVPWDRRVYLEAFGCQMNKLDAELMMDVLIDEGYSLTDDLQEAGVILYNTCAVREQAENRVFSRVGGLKGLKRRRPGLVIGVLGCSAQNHRESIFKRYPHVSIVCGTGEFLRLPELIATARREGRVAALALDLETTPRFTRTKNLGPNPYQAFVSVMRGCDQACTFCVVPRTRGKEVSRPVREIVEECRALADGGVREVTLLGQTVNSYGKRLQKGRAIGLQHVLWELEKVRGLERIRFITSHPRFMNPELIDAMAGLEKVCEYLHLPVQSGSDAVLRRMLRTYTIEHYRRVAGLCREKIEDLALATDLIVGFPGETAAEFEETVRLMEELRFQGAFVFRYSERKGTRAAEAHADDVPEEVKRERNQTLLALTSRISSEIHRDRVGRTEDVLVEGLSKLDSSRLTGRNRRNQIVVFPGAAREGLEGKLVPIRITGSTALVLIGERAGPGS
ncbi:MAG TPA: tRNA (N6-isopentenyl adenosine(37)-C2)-methylthiotransferase MiaB [Planctomycetota bacterium]|nr:tRNA (N6-isopentenyl adenosine(37)-C2)-methylthiotransferase MiaB [Planctomycetota bacterium]